MNNATTTAAATTAAATTAAATTAAATTAAATTAAATTAAATTAAATTAAATTAAATTASVESETNRYHPINKFIVDNVNKDLPPLAQKTAWVDFDILWTRYVGWCKQQHTIADQDDLRNAMEHRFDVMQECAGFRGWRKIGLWTETEMQVRGQVAEGGDSGGAAATTTFITTFTSSPTTFTTSPTSEPSEPSPDTLIQADVENWRKLSAFVDIQGQQLHHIQEQWYPTVEGAQMAGHIFGYGEDTERGYDLVLKMVKEMKQVSKVRWAQTRAEALKRVRAKKKKKKTNASNRPRGRPSKGHQWSDEQKGYVPIVATGETAPVAPALTQLAASLVTPLPPAMPLHTTPQVSRK